MNPRMPPLPPLPQLLDDLTSKEMADEILAYALSAQRAAWNAAIQCSMEEMQRQRQKWDGPFYRCSEVLEDAIRSLKEPDHE